MWAATVAQRAVQLVLTLFAVSSLLFVLLHVSGDPAATLAGPGASIDTLTSIRHTLGLDRPLWLQYLTFLGNVATLHFGVSLTSHVSALGLVWHHLPYTVGLAAAAIALTALVSIPLGVWLALHKRSPLARPLTGLVILGQSVPGFVTGLLLILVFAVYLHWLPVFGADSPRSIILPTATLTAYLLPKATRLVRAGAAGVASETYVRMARAKGLRRRTVARRFVLRNALATVATVLTLQLAQLLGGAIVVEAVFAWPGIGNLVVNSVLNNDFPVVEATVFAVAILVVAVNLALDLSLPFLDPRLRDA